MPNTPKIEVTQADILDYFKRRRGDAMPLLKIPVFDARVSACAFAICVSSILLRRQVSRIRARCRRSKRQDIRDLNKRLNSLPENVSRRRAAYAAIRADPEKLAEYRRNGVESFKRNKASIYAYRKTRPDIYTYAGNADYFRDYQNNKRRTDPQACIANRMRSRLRHAVTNHGGRKSDHTFSLVGCSLPDLVKHLESLFTEGMTWKRFLAGEIEIDHIRPCASFDLTDPEQQRACFFWKNLQPLWTSENRSKGARLLTPALVSV